MDEFLGVSDAGVVTVKSETGAVMRKIEGSLDPAAWMLDNPKIPRTPQTVYRAGCYICEDDEFARMGMPLCKPCPKCEGGHIAADDTVCDKCGYDLYEEDQ